MLENLFCDIDESWIIIGVLFLLLLTSGDKGCGCDGGFFGKIGGLFEDNALIIILLIALLFIDF
jgi:hypothetical protein